MTETTHIIKASAKPRRTGWYWVWFFEMEPGDMSPLIRYWDGHWWRTGRAGKFFKESTYGRIGPRIEDFSE